MTHSFPWLLQPSFNLHLSLSTKINPYSLLNSPKPTHFTIKSQSQQSQPQPNLTQSTNSNTPTPSPAKHRRPNISSPPNTSFSTPIHLPLNPTPSTKSFTNLNPATSSTFNMTSPLSRNSTALRFACR
ncbi:threonine synthase, chloroplastic [Trifolium repens]|nr:threonine synthase, chloroplastic [Trifolium repens]